MVVIFVFVISNEDILVGLAFLRFVLSSNLQIKQGIAQDRVPGEYYIC